MRSKLKVGVLIGLCLIFIFFSGAVRASVSNSLILCAKILIPSLFPFFVLSGMIGDMGLASLFGVENAAMLTGLICGYPLGARAVCEYYNEGSLSQSQANKLLLCTSNASPAFLVLAVGKGMLGDELWGMKLLLIQSFGALLIFLCLIPKNESEKIIGKSVSLTSSLVNNLKNATEQMLLVCGTTVFFGIFYDFSKCLPLPVPILKIIGGMIELTHGCTGFSVQSLLPLAFIIGLSGICVWVQCSYYIKNSDLSVGYLIIGKLMQAVWMPTGVLLLQNIHLLFIFLTVAIFILTNGILLCIIKKKRCEKIDFFKRY